MSELDRRITGLEEFAGHERCRTSAMIARSPVFPVREYGEIKVKNDNVIFSVFLIKSDVSVADISMKESNLLIKNM